MTPDLTALRERATAGAAPDAVAALEDCIAAARSIANANTFTRTHFDTAAETARQVDAQHAAGGLFPPLAGRAVSVKDLFDMQGEVTTAGSTALARREP